MGGAYEFAKTASANLRRKDDSWNPAIGGFFGGATLGLRCMCAFLLNLPPSPLLLLLLPLLLPFFSPFFPLLLPLPLPISCLLPYLLV